VAQLVHGEARALHSKLDRDRGRGLRVRRFRRRSCRRSRPRARALFDEAGELERQGQWSAAQERLRAAIRIHETPHLRYALGWALENDDKLLEARVQYETALRLAFNARITTSTNASGRSGTSMRGSGTGSAAIEAMHADGDSCANGVRPVTSS
jgi:hypothetical protein